MLNQINNQLDWILVLILLMSYHQTDESQPDLGAVHKGPPHKIAKN